MSANDPKRTSQHQTCRPTATVSQGHLKLVPAPFVKILPPGFWIMPTITVVTAPPLLDIISLFPDPQHSGGIPLYRRGLRRRQLHVASWHAGEKETESLGHGRVGEHGVA